MDNGETTWKNFFYSKWFLVAVILAICLVGFAFFKSFYQDYQVRQEIERLKEEASRLEAKKLESLELLKYVQSADFVESKARTDFNLVKPGEQVAVIAGVNSTQTQSGQGNDNMINYGRFSNPIKWWRFFTNSKK